MPTASDWAVEVRGVLHKMLADHGCDMAITRHVDAAIESLRIPGDCVRLPDGRGVKVGDGVLAILAERERQVSAEGWTSHHDDQYDRGLLAQAAACYAIPEELRNADMLAAVPDHWPFHSHWWKPTPGDRIRELTKAGALIAAEIDRLKRAAEAAMPKGDVGVPG